MKSFFLKVSLFAGLSLSGFCSVFAQTKTEVINTYLKVTSEEDFVEDGVYVVVAPLKEDSTIMAVMSKVADIETHRNSVFVSDEVLDNQLYISSSMIATKNNLEGAYEFYLRNSKGGCFNLFDCVNEQYLIAPCSQKKRASGYTKSSKIYISLLSYISYEYKKYCQVTISDWVNYKIEFNPDGKDYYRYLKYNQSNDTPYFSCYTNGSSGSFAQLYRKVIPIKMTSAGYSTLCADYAFKMPEGLTGGIVKSVNGTNLTIDYCYPTDSIVPAHTPIILKGAENTYNASVMSVEGNTYEGNYLYATVDTEGNTSVDGDKDNKYRYYKLAKYNNEVGFWWNAKGGGPFKNGKNKAYLALARNSGVAEVKGFTLEGLEQTGISNATTQENATSTAVYDLNGKLMPQTQTRSLPAGVYIINGKVTILKNNR